MINVKKVLNELGITQNYRGYRRTVLAMEIVLQDECCFDAMVARVYIPVGENQGCTWSAVDRSLRTVVAKVWDTNRKKLIEISGRRMTDRPTVSEFIAILYNYITNENS